MTENGMRLYECVIITRQNYLQNNNPAELITKVETILGEKGKIERYEYWGVNNFTYIIKRKRRGHYVLLYLKMMPDFVEILQRKMSLDDNILRYIVISIDSIPEDQSPMAKEIGVDSNDNESDDPIIGEEIIKLDIKAIDKNANTSTSADS